MFFGSPEHLNFFRDTRFYHPTDDMRYNKLACSNNSNVHQDKQLSDLLQDIGVFCAPFLSMNKSCLHVQNKLVVSLVACPNVTQNHTSK